MPEKTSEELKESRAKKNEERAKKNEERAQQRAKRRANRMTRIANATKNAPTGDEKKPKAKKGCGSCSRAKKKQEDAKKEQAGDPKFEKKNNPSKNQRKVVIQNFTSPGDIMMITPVVKGLVEAHGDKFAVDVRTTCAEIWEHNPYLTPIPFMTGKDGKPVDEDGNEVIVIDAKADDLINSSRTNPFHYIHAYAWDIGKKLGVSIPLEFLKGDIYLTHDEVSWMSQVQESTGLDDKYWIINAGGKFDVTVKWWNPDFYQEVVDYFKGKITFVQVGTDHDLHPPLKNVINMIGKTSLRQLTRMIYHSVGVLTPVSFAMHASAAIPVPAGRCKSRACVVVAGGREPQQWEAYPNHRFLSTNGAMDCCDNNGCWKSRTFNLEDGTDKKGTRCYYPLRIDTKTKIPDATIPVHIKGKESDKKEISFEKFPIAKCMQLIKPKHVIQAIEGYYEGGCLSYGSSIPDNISEKAKEFITE